MNLANPTSHPRPMQTRRTANASGMSLIEMLVALAVGALVLTVVAVLSVYALRSFTAMGNYADLEAQSRTALDWITRDLRQATAVVSFSQNGPEKWIRVTNALEETSRKYIWDAEERELNCEEEGQPLRTYLTECDEWNFVMYQRTPIVGLTNQFYPTTNTSMCKMIEINWRCSRAMLGKKWSTESVQSAQIVLRTP